jgi:uncharacterized membrane protein/uncharacterized RDD family membrane protein YckC
VVDPIAVTVDISSVAISTALPGIAWALLFALAWRHPAFAESIGFGPKTFWLLLPGAILASFALLPLAAISDDILAVSFAGAVFPLAIAVVGIERFLQPFGPRALRLFVPLAVETAALLAVVLAADAGRLGTLAGSVGVSTWGLELALVAAVAAVIPGVLLALPASRPGGTGRAEGGTLALTSMVLVLTFVGARAIPGVGIAEAFPYFLLPPVLAGVVAAILAPKLFPEGEGFALPAAFFAGGWGVVLGADILWQPPLYNGGPGGLYAIGGAGVLDLVYLSGFLGLLAAWGLHRAFERGYRPVGPAIPPSPPSPSRELREAFAFVTDGAPEAALRASAAAGRASALQAHALVGKPPADPARPWNGLAVPGWVVSDQANLDSVARSGSSDVGEAMRGFVTARALVRLGASLGRPRFASIAQRLAAFAIDLVVLGGAGAAVFAGLVLVTPGGLNGVLGSAAFNAAIYGFVGMGLLYFALGEFLFGATPGKAILRIEVRDRSLGPVGGVAAFVRNTPLLPVLTLYAVGLALSIAIALRGIPANASLAALGLSAGALAIATLVLVVLAGVGLAGALGIAVIAVTSERQRVGDLWAGTWVLRRVSAPASPPSAAPPAGRSG